jgi:CTP:molybdopterin cytidylyltransferase MocA
MLSAVPHITLVLGSQAQRIREAAPLDARVSIVVNKEFARGQLSSLKVGLRASLPNASAVMVHLIDHPLVVAATFAGLVAEYERIAKPIVIARWDGRRGHPVIFDGTLFDELLRAPEEQGARSVVNAESSRVGYFDAPDSGIVMDLDTPADVAQAGLKLPAHDEKQ